MTSHATTLADRTQRRVTRRALVLSTHLPYAALLVVGTVLLAWLALKHHAALGTGYDLGIYDQVVWNLSHGRLFSTTLVYETGGYYDHLEPVLALLAPLYWLWSDVRVLLIAQSVALGLGSLPVYLYARWRLGGAGAQRTWLPLLLTVAYLAYPALHNANLNDFHEVSLLPPLLGFALYGLLTGRRCLLLVFLILGLMVKEDFAVTALAISVYIFALKPQGFTRRDGLLMGVGVVAWILLVLFVLYPALTHGMPYPFVARRYGWLGSSPESAARALLTQPWIVLPYLLQPPKLDFILRLFGPLLFMPLLAWPLIGLAFPILIYLMMSSYEPQWSVQSYYNPPLIPFLFLSLVQTWAFILQRVQRRPGAERWAIALLSLALLAGVGYRYRLDAIGPGGLKYAPADFATSARTGSAAKIVAMIPPDASVSTVWPLVSHLSQRERIYTLLARPVLPPEYRLIEDDPGAQGAPLYPFAAPPGWPPVYHHYVGVHREGPFELQRLAQSVTMLPLPESQPPSRPIELAAYAWFDSPDPAQAPAVAPGQTVRLMLAWQRHGPVDRRFVFFVHVLDLAHSGPNGSGQITASSGHEAGDGRYPTTHWSLWTQPAIVIDEQQITIPEGTPAGTYDVWAGAFDHASQDRLELGGSGQTLIKVGTLRVVQ